MDDDQNWGWFGKLTGFIGRVLMKLGIVKADDK
jgi:hypothetical protein